MRFIFSNNRYFHILLTSAALQYFTSIKQQHSGVTRGGGRPEHFARAQDFRGRQIKDFEKNTEVKNRFFRIF